MVTKSTKWDDLDDSKPADSTVVIDGLSGKTKLSYDLCKENVSRLEHHIKSFFKGTEKVSAVKEPVLIQRRPRLRSHQLGDDMRREIREWAWAAGYDIGVKGVLPEAVIQEFLDAAWVSNYK